MKNIMKSMHRRNGDKEVEHPKPMIEILSNSYEAIQTYAAKMNIPFEQSAQVLIFNEIRCVHYHFDRDLAEKEEERRKAEKELQDAG